MKRSVLAGAVGVLFCGAAVGALMLADAAAKPRARPTAGDACGALERHGLFPQTKVSSTKKVEADKGLPAYCEVTATVSPTAGSKIGVVYRLPAGWNGKMLGLGGGGWMGNLSLQSASEGLKAGYATAQTDGGHAFSPNLFDTSWASGADARTDFAWRGVHLMTETGKKVVASYYGHPHRKAYWQGCSTGGRQGLMEVQRFPADYDGVITGAPVYNLLVQTSGLIRNNAFSAPGASFTAPQLKLVNNAVLAACDAKDGLKDGIVGDPRACTWDPAEIQCKRGASGDECLSDAQVKALRSVYAGVKIGGGQVGAWPLSRGGETGWSLFISTPGPTQNDRTNGGGGLGGLRGPLLSDPDFDISRFDPARDVPKVMSAGFGKAYNADNPSIGAFTKRGGKLLMWHGWYDPGPSPVGTITYYDRAKRATPAAASNVRLFLLPGVFHCGSGPGPDKVDWLSALDQWVTTGKPPATLLATKANAKISRTLCPYPAQPHYKGSGDPDDAANFDCR